MAQQPLPLTHKAVPAKPQPRVDRLEPGQSILDEALRRFDQSVIRARTLMFGPAAG